MKQVLLVLAGWVHPPIRGRLWLKQTLARVPGYAFDEVSSLAQAARRGLSSYSALVLYYHHPQAELTGDALAAFRSFVQNGGGVLAVHSATASYKQSPGYFEVLGGRFTGHGRVGRIDVRPAQDDDEIFAGIPAFTVRDELYVHALQPDIRVHFHADHRGQAVPMVWTRIVDGGRVCYVCPGHRAASMRHAAVQDILQRAMRWVSGQ